MALVNENFLKLPVSYLFTDIARKVNAFRVTNPDADIIRLGIGDVTQPLAPAVIAALHKATDEMASEDLPWIRARTRLRVPARGNHQERLPASRHPS